MLDKALELIKTILTLGKEPQSFISARWILFILWICPSFCKRKCALWIISLSPHYFYRHINPAYSTMSLGNFLEKEYIRNQSTREKIAKQVLQLYLTKEDTILDYGCGPGFLAKATSLCVRKVYATDISTGVIACARIINKSRNIEYFCTTKKDFYDLKSESIDKIYSIAVVQHMTNSAFKGMLKQCKNLLKNNGLLIMQIQLDEDTWRTEKDYREDKTLSGKLRFKYALHGFARTKIEFERILQEFDFQIINLLPIKDLVEEDFDDVCKQHLLVVKRDC